MDILSWSLVSDRIMYLYNLVPVTDICFWGFILQTTLKFFISLRLLLLLLLSQFSGGVTAEFLSLIEFKFQCSIFSSACIQKDKTKILNPNSTLTLNNGIEMPRIGLGAYKSSPGTETRQSVHWAIQNQYHMIDTATRYGNENDIGDVMRLENVDRSSMFIVTKVWDDMHGYEETVDSLKLSLKLLGIKFVDLYLIHSPVGGKIVETWKAMIDLMDQGYTRFDFLLLNR